MLGYLVGFVENVGELAARVEREKGYVEVRTQRHVGEDGGRAVRKEVHEGFVGVGGRVGDLWEACGKDCGGMSWN